MASPYSCGRSHSDAWVGWLHGLVDHGQDLGGQGVQVDLVAQAGAERLDHPAGVVAAA